MKRVLIAVMFIGLAIMLILPTACAKSSSTATTPNTITIGDVDIYSGPIAEEMLSTEQGVTIAKDFINSLGGVTINGVKYNIEVYVADDKMDPTAAAAAANDCVSRGIKFIIGSAPTFLSLATASVTEPNGIFYMPMYDAGLATEFDPATCKYKFYPNNGTYESDAAVFQYLKANYPDVKNLAYIIIDDGSIQGSDANVRKIAAQYGLNIIGDTIGYSMDTVDYNPIAQKAIAKNPDAVFVSNGIGVAEGNILKDLRTMGYKGLVFSNTLNPIDYVLPIAGSAMSTGFFRPAFDVNTPDQPPILQQLTNYVKNYWPDKKLGYVRLSFANALYTEVQCMVKAQSLEPKVVAADWNNWTTIDTLWGTSKIGGKSIYGINHELYNPTPIQELENGKIVYKGWIPASDIYQP